MQEVQVSLPGRGYSLDQCVFNAGATAPRQHGWGFMIPGRRRMLQPASFFLCVLSWRSI